MLILWQAHLSLGYPCYQYVCTEIKVSYNLDMRVLFDRPEPLRHGSGKALLSDACSGGGLYEQAFESESLMKV